MRDFTPEEWNDLYNNGKSIEYSHQTMNEKAPQSIDTINVNRVEVIDHTRPTEEGGGRVYVYWEPKGCTVELSLQDDGRTLKIFIS